MVKRRPQQRNGERIAFAREQRQHSNEFSSLVWNMLRNRKVMQQKFRREHSFGPYTLDFVCLALKLVIEIDGKEHFTAHGTQRDAQRDAYLHKHGLQVLRIEGFRVTQDGPGVRDAIEQAVKQRMSELGQPPAPSSPTLLPRSTGGRRE